MEKEKKNKFDEVYQRGLTHGMWIGAIFTIFFFILAKIFFPLP